MNQKIRMVEGELARKKNKCRNERNFCCENINVQKKTHIT